MTASSVPSRLQTVDWNDLMPRLLLVARRFHRRALRAYSGAPDPRDLVQQAITDVLDGRRRLPPDVPVFTVLCGVMRSQVSNYVSRQQPVGPGADSDETRLAPLLMEVADASYTPTQKLDTDELRDGLYRIVGDDDLARGVIDLLLEDSTLKPADLADMLDVDVRAIYNTKRRLRRKLEKAPDSPLS